MKAACVILIVCFILSCSRLPETMAETDEPFDRSVFDSLEKMSNTVIEQDGRQYTLVLYFNELTCMSCVSREVEGMKKFYDSNPRNIEFLLIAHDDNDAYLNNLRRVGRIKFPILRERHLGTSGFPNKLSLYLIDNNSQTAIIKYFPEPGPAHADDFKEFEILVRDKTDNNRP